MRTAIRCLLAVTVFGMTAAARADGERPEVLVLGTYHMANPGHDIFNMQADDVLAPKRQQEIAELLTVLARFNPTKIAIERDTQKTVDEVYRKYLAGEYALTANEIDQIGLRLAKTLHHPTVYAVDADGDFPFLRLVHYAKGTDQSAELDKIMADIGAMVKAQDAYLKSHTVLETLLYMNADAKVAEDVGYYYREARIGEPWDYAGPDLLAEWYRRNVRIFNNVARIATAPDDRILVLFGAGHLGWLRQAFAGDPGLRLRKLEEFAPGNRP